MAKSTHYCPPLKIAPESGFEEIVQARKGLRGLSRREKSPADLECQETSVVITKHTFSGLEGTLKQQLRNLIKKFRGDALSATIRESRRILALQPGWDGELDSPAHAEETLNRA